MQSMVGVHNRADHLRQGMERTLDGLARQVERTTLAVSRG
jgi:hypothetical protein